MPDEPDLARLRFGGLDAVKHIPQSREAFLDGRSLGGIWRRTYTRQVNAACWQIDRLGDDLDAVSSRQELVARILLADSMARLAQGARLTPSAAFR